MKQARYKSRTMAHWLRRKAYLATPCKILSPEGPLLRVKPVYLLHPYTISRNSFYDFAPYHKRRMSGAVQRRREKISQNMCRVQAHGACLSARYLATGKAVSISNPIQDTDSFNSLSRPQFVPRKS